MEVRVPANMMLYKRMNSGSFNTDRQGPVWFALEDTVVETYGSRLHTIRCGIELKLLNIMSWQFRIDFLDRMNNYFAGQDLTNASYRRLKALSMIALGLPNLETQCSLMTKYFQNAPSPMSDENMKLDTCGFMGHRLSETQIDKEMTRLLMLLYGEYDGYIQQYRLASCWMDAFPAEVCLFNGARCSLSVLQLGGRKTRRQKNLISHKGGMSNTSFHDVMYKKMNDEMFDPDKFRMETNAICRMLLRSDGFSMSEIDSMVDTNNYIKMPDVRERMEKRQTSRNFPSKKELDDIAKELNQGVIEWRR